MKKEIEYMNYKKDFEKKLKLFVERGMFSKLGEEWFDDYWRNFNKITQKNGTKINSLVDFVNYRNGDISLIVVKNNKKLVIEQC